MLILALDMATTTGFCRGTTDVMPKSGAVMLRGKGDHVSVVGYNFMSFLRDVNQMALPDLIVYESPMPIGALAKFERPQNEETARMPFYLEGALFTWCLAKEVAFKDVSPHTYRSHFLGKGRKADPNLSKDRQRLELKKDMLAQCKRLGYVHKDRWPHRADASDPLYDIADACGLWDYAAATWGRRIPKELHMFGEPLAAAR